MVYTVFVHYTLFEIRFIEKCKNYYDKVIKNVVYNMTSNYVKKRIFKKKKIYR